MSAEHRGRAALLAGVLLSGALAACSPAEPEPGPAAHALAAALAAGTADDVAWENPEEATEQIATIFEGVADVPRHVQVAAVEQPYEEGGVRLADAELAWTWDLGPEDWTYPTRATLVMDDDAEAWRVRWHRTVVAPELAEASALVAARSTGARGDILGAGGRPIVVATPVLDVGLDKSVVDGEEALRASAEAIARLAGYEDPAPYVEQVLAAGPRAFVEAITVREGSDVVDLEALEEVPGGLAMPGELPLAPTAEFARPLLGRVGPATAEIVEETEGAVQPGELTGLSGLQRRYDDLLRGEVGLTIRAVDAVGAETVIAQSPPQDGADLTITLDVDLQLAAEDILADVPSPAGLVALRPSTGEVLAAASGPASEGHSTATLGQYAPGSTFKIVSALALLRAGFTPDTPVACEPEASVEGYPFGNYPEYPAELETTIPFATAFAHSCNTSFVTEADAVTGSGLAAAAEALGLGVEATQGWPAFLGEVPADTAGTDHAASLIGQGRVLASPLAMATVAASVAAGTAVSPVLITAPERVADAGVLTPSAPVTEAEAAALRDLMRRVVTDGTGSALADVPGEPVLAKTGTAQHGSGESYRLDGWLVAVQGDLAVAVLVEAGGSGAEAAAPLVEAFLTAAG